MLLRLEDIPNTKNDTKMVASFSMPFFSADEYFDSLKPKPKKDGKSSRYNWYNEKTSIEKLFTMPSNLFEVVDHRPYSVVDEPTHAIPKFVEGEYYSLQGIACDGFEMKEKIYQLIGTIDQFQGTDINSVIVKQVSGDIDKIFTLSKNDCAFIGIEYQSGLQLFPKNLPWKLVKDEVPFNRYDLGTVPLSRIDNTVRHILFKLNGFSDYRNGYIVTPSGHLVKEDKFKKSLRVQAKEPIVYGSSYKVNDYTNLNVNIVYPKNVLFNHGNFISSDDEIYLLLTLLTKDKEGTNTVDGYFGVEKTYFDGINPNDFFEISWDEYGTKTVEQYEHDKEQEAKAKEDFIRMEEARQRELEEARKLEESKKVNKAVNTVNKFKNKTIRTSKKSPLHLKNGMLDDGSIGFIDMAVNTFDSYFKELQTSLNHIDADVSFLEETFSDLDLGW